MEERTGAEIIVDHLIDRKTPYILAVGGHSDAAVLDAALDRRNSITAISAHHEQTAGFMADAYFRLTGVPLATATSVGPGCSNIHTPVANAYFDSYAMLAITGNINTSMFNKGAMQELGHHYQADFTSAMRPYVKRAFHAPRVEMLPEMMRHVYTSMLSGRAGPVNLDVPLNVLSEKTAEQPVFNEDWRGNVYYGSQADPAALERAVDLLLSAERPIILAGQGSLYDHAEDVILELAELTQIPVATSPLGKGAIDEYHRLSLGPTGRDGVYPGNRATRECDVLLALGTRFGDRSTSSWREGVTHTIAKTKLIHVDVEPGQLGKNYPPEVGIVGSAKLVTRQIIDLLKAKGGLERSIARRADWSKRVQGWKATWDGEFAESKSRADVPIHPERFVAELSRATPKNAIISADIGSNHSWMVQQWRVPRGGHMLQSGGYACMGFGICGAVGAKLAAPDRPVLSVVGDGSFVMHSNAVLTAVEYDLPVVWVVWNNCGYVAIRDVQNGFFGKGREIATRFRKKKTGELFSADLAMMARAMGARGEQVDQPGELGDAIKEAIDSGQPTVLDVRVSADIVRKSSGLLDFPPFQGSTNYDPDPMH
jgi:acetolactate synthase-1/2/3 large subunit